MVVFFFPHKYDTSYSLAETFFRDTIVEDLCCFFPNDTDVGDLFPSTNAESLLQ